jgi:hypothetical protein
MDGHELSVMRSLHVLRANAATEFRVLNDLNTKAVSGGCSHVSFLITSTHRCSERGVPVHYRSAPVQAADLRNRWN